MINLAHENRRIRDGEVTIASLAEVCSPRPWSVGEIRAATDQVGVYDANGAPIAVTGRVRGDNRVALDNALMICSAANGIVNIIAAAERDAGAVVNLTERLEQIDVLAARIGALVHLVDRDADERDETLARIANVCVDDITAPWSRDILAAISDDRAARSDGGTLVERVRTAAGVNTKAE